MAFLSVVMTYRPRGSEGEVLNLSPSEPQKRNAPVNAIAAVTATIRICEAEVARKLLNRPVSIMSNGSFKVGELFALLRSSIACRRRASLRDDVAMANHDFVYDPFRTVFWNEFALFDRSFDKHVFAFFECRSKL